MTQHLNYCRSMVKQFTSTLSSPNVPGTSRQILSHAIDLSKASQKFMLPKGGRLYDDPDFRALDESQSLDLPFPMIALEYERAGAEPKPGQHRSSKAIVFVRERDDAIVMLPVAWADHAGVWAPFPELAIPRTNFLRRDTRVNGYVGVNGFIADPRFTTNDYADEIGALMCLLNVLRCANVHTERSEPSKVRKAIKSALPFDAYHILTIDAPAAGGSGSPTGGHRSPREHLRRGHIRRLADGRRIWVNATVVGAGRGAGIITKDYAIRNRTNIERQKSGGYN